MKWRFVNFIDNLNTGTSHKFNTSINKLINKTQQDSCFPRLATICYAGRQKCCDWGGTIGDQDCNFNVGCPSLPGGDKNKTKHLKD